MSRNKIYTNKNPYSEISFSFLQTEDGKFLLLEDCGKIIIGGVISYKSKVDPYSSSN